MLSEYSRMQPQAGEVLPMVNFGTIEIRRDLVHREVGEEWS
jgi:hypothetical protein